MTKPMLLAEFTRLPPVLRATVVDGLSAAIDDVAEAAPTSHTFLRYQWYAAALRAYGGAARTMVVEDSGKPLIALPMTAFGPGMAGMAVVPGCYWPFRSFPVTADAPDDAFDLLADRLASTVRLLRIGPVYDGDPAAARLIAAASRRGWTAIDRFIADDYILDIAARRAEGWPRGSTLRKNRFHEKHLAEHGALDWRFLDGAALTGGGFEALAAIEEKSWIAARTDGSDAKFTPTGHGAFWRAAAEDPVLAAMMRAALLTIDGRPAAFSFDVSVGPLRYAIANSYDPAVARHSPGKLLYYRNLVAAMEAGTTTVDWGAGDSGYKQVIGAERGPAIRDWLLVRPGLSALAALLARGRWASSGQPMVRSTANDSGAEPAA